MNKVNYTELYKIQDRVLDIVFSLDHDFYLTGGTCLGRFYWEKRYSDDLDFFTNSSSLFGINIRNIINVLSKNLSVKEVVESKDFVRLMADNILQLDFVNDRVPRYKSVTILKQGYRIDNVENILSNKITAVISRDNPKDIFDIYLISKFHDFVWQDILTSAKDKLVFNIDDLVYRMKSFPLNLLKKIDLADPDFLNNFESEFVFIIEDIINKSRNRLYG